MKKRLTHKLSSLVLLAGLSALQGTSFAAPGNAQDDAAQIKRGEQSAQVCGACHGLDGNTASPDLYPNIAGQLPDYIVLQLTNFRSGERPNPLMKGIAASLPQSEMHDLAAYFAAKHAKPQPSVDKALETKGRQIFASGSSAGAPACATCHGKQGHGQAPFPRIASQPMKYTLEQLHVYRDAPKFNNPLASEMKTVALKVSEEEMRAVSAYLATLE